MVARLYPLIACENRHFFHSVSVLLTLINSHVGDLKSATYILWEEREKDGFEPDKHAQIVFSSIVHHAVWSRKRAEHHCIWDGHVCVVILVSSSTSVRLLSDFPNWGRSILFICVVQIYRCSHVLSGWVFTSKNTHIVDSTLELRWTKNHGKNPLL